MKKIAIYKASIVYPFVNYEEDGDFYIILGSEHMLRTLAYSNSICT